VPTDWTTALTVDARDPLPIHAQLERSIRAAIASKRLRPGDQLPTVRQLAVALRVNANTVAKVYSHLERTRALETRRGVGTFVADATPVPSTKSQRAELRAIATRALADASVYGWTADDLVRELQTLSKGGS
jgi:GntR family transcriptional regulator